MNQIRSRINALRRKMALEISVVRLRPVADDFCLEWSVAVSDRRTPPDDHTFIRRVVDAGFRLPTFMAAHRYLTRCLTENIVPGCEHLLGALLPWAAVRGLVVLSDDPPATPVPQSA